MSSDLADSFLNLFQGSAHKHGHTLLLGTTRGADGKQEVSCRTANGPATTALWEAHMSGGDGLGVIPIRRDTNDSRFGAIDIDDKALYTGEKTLEKINKEVYASNLPVIVCRSKSGGAHIFLFTSDWVPAALLRQKLEMIAAFLGYANAEIFPAQSVLTNETSDGNWLNMPYYGGPKTMRYGLHPDGSAMSPEEFIAATKRVILTPTQLKDLSIVSAKKEDELFPDGPVCLETVFQRVRSRSLNPERNTTIFACSVYANLRWPGPDNAKKREDFIVMLNNLFSTPLPMGELSKTVLASDKKGRTAECKYQCPRCPLKDHCNASLCKQRKYGIGAYNGSVVRTLSKVDTEPPLWILTVDEQRIHLTTEELHNYSLLQRRVMEATNILLPMMKAADWQENLRNLLSEVHVLRTFQNSSAIAEMIEKIYVWLYSVTKDQEKLDSVSIESVLTGNVYKNEVNAIFIPQFLYQKLKLENDREGRKLVDHVLFEYFQASEIRPNIEPRMRCFCVPVRYTKIAPEMRDDKKGTNETI